MQNRLHLFDLDLTLSKSLLLSFLFSLIDLCLSDLVNDTVSHLLINDRSLFFNDPALQLRECHRLRLCADQRLWRISVRVSIQVQDPIWRSFYYICLACFLCFSFIWFTIALRCLVHHEFIDRCLVLNILLLVVWNEWAESHIVRLAWSHVDSSIPRLKRVRLTRDGMVSLELLVNTFTALLIMLRLSEDTRRYMLCFSLISDDLAVHAIWHLLLNMVYLLDLMCLKIIHLRR